MLKKVGIGIALAGTVLFGSAFSQQDVEAEQQAHIQSKINSNIDWTKIQNGDIQSLIDKLCNNLSNGEEQSNKQKQEDKAKEQEQQTEQNTEQEKQQPVAKEEPKKEQKEEPKEEPATEQKAPEQTNNNTEQAKEPSNTQEQNDTEQLSQFEQQVVALTNEERQKQGLSALEIDTELSKVAREKSNDMATNGYFSHNSPTYGSPFDMMKQFGISYKTAGENIAKGQQTPEEVVNAWMNSEGHRANILNPDFTHIGVGYVEQGNVWTQQFIGK
ncbi:CAP domain-containing protein [Gracilibacillus sp. JCM 18860]|uniref:CAP domain-containing protein n=1 Tax=Gracilibacillus sp. JCM 18860 TaxID=1306159 RepID=UPI0006CF9364